MSLPEHFPPGGNQRFAGGPATDPKDASARWASIVCTGSRQIAARRLSARCASVNILRVGVPCPLGCIGLPACLVALGTFGEYGAHVGDPHHHVSGQDGGEVGV